jgi:hypothetical protein
LKATLLKTTELDNQDLFYIFQSCRILIEYLLKFKEKFEHNSEEIYDNMINKIRDIIKYYVSKYPFINLSSNNDDKNESIWAFDTNNNGNDNDSVKKEILEEDEFSDWDADTNDDESDNEKSISISKDISSKTLKEIQDIIALLNK